MPKIYAHAMQEDLVWGTQETEEPLHRKSTSQINQFLFAFILECKDTFHDFIGFA